jgi:hypothetical protein
VRYEVRVSDGSRFKLEQDEELKVGGGIGPGLSKNGLSSTRSTRSTCSRHAWTPRCSSRAAAAVT